MKVANVLPKLGYEYNSLEPFIDEKTMILHYTKHHQGYVDKLNKALEKYPKLLEKHAEELLKEISKIPKDIRTVVVNNGGGHVNHSFFWKILKKGVNINGEVLEAINNSFGDFDNFKKMFKESALGLFGSGWAWLVLDKKKLKIVTTHNQNSPISEGLIPVLGIDVWEHAYYLKYQNRRAEYVDAFFNVINWDAVNQNFIDAKKIRRLK
jgi:Fe-Mn family superoxide dismutase